MKTHRDSSPGVWGLLLAIILVPACFGRPTPAPTVPATPASEPAPAVVTFYNVTEPNPGVYAGGQPTLDELRAASEAGVKTIVNLRTKGEKGEIPDEEAQVSALGMRYVWIPVGGAADYGEENLRKLAGILDDPAALPVIVHCRSGGRVGRFLGLVDELRASPKGSK